jgi:hypothetical protein
MKLKGSAARGKWLGIVKPFKNVIISLRVGFSRSGGSGRLP